MFRRARLRVPARGVSRDAPSPTPDRSAGTHAEPISPTPERAEPPLERPGLTDLSLTDTRAALQRAISRFRAEQFTDTAAALAYNAFMAALVAGVLSFIGVFIWILERALRLDNGPYL